MHKANKNNNQTKDQRQRSSIISYNIERRKQSKVQDDEDDEDDENDDKDEGLSAGQDDSIPPLQPHAKQNAMRKRELGAAAAAAMKRERPAGQRLNSDIDVKGAPE